MLYEPPKTKRYILIGAATIVLAVLAIVITPLLFKKKTTLTPTANLPLTAEQKKAENSLKKLQEMEKSQKIQAPSQEQIQNSLHNLSKESGDTPSQDQIKKSLDNLSKMQK